MFVIIVVRWIILIGMHCVQANVHVCVFHVNIGQAIYRPRSRHNVESAVDNLISNSLDAKNCIFAANFFVRSYITQEAQLRRDGAGRWSLRRSRSFKVTDFDLVPIERPHRPIRLPVYLAPFASFRRKCIVYICFKFSHNPRNCQFHS